MSLQKEEIGVPSTYIQNPDSMMELKYKCVFFVARKPLDSSSPGEACPPNRACPSDDTDKHQQQQQKTTRM